MKKLIFLLSGDLEEVAFKEVEVFSQDVLKGCVVEKGRQVAVAEVGEVKDLHRLSLVHEVCEFLFSCSLDELVNFVKEVEVPEGKMCVRVRNIGGRKVNSPELERNLGAIFYKRGAKISVSAPDRVFRVYVSDKVYAGWLLHVTNTKQFLERRPDLKPFFRPGAIVPRFARSLVNITGVENGLILDPMCGTGTIVIEAGLMGLDFFGVEAFENIARGCAINLKYYGLPVNVSIGDARSLPLRDDSVDGIVTDFPYLQSSKSFGELKSLYEDAFPEFHRVLRGKRIVFLTNMDVEDYFADYFELESKFYQKVHKSLTRRIYVCKKKG